MTMLDTGIIGAKRQSWKSSNPRDLLKRLIDDNPRSSESEIQELMAEQIERKGAEEYRSTIFEYWFTNNYRSLVHPARTGISRTQTRARLDGLKEKITQHVAKIVLGNITLPSGKHLKDATGKECRDLGGWFGRIATKVKPGEIVGQVLSEADLKKLYRAGT